MSAARFIFIACTAFLVARVATNGVCSGNMNDSDKSSYERALKNSINKFLNSLRDGVSKTGLRLVNTTTIADFIARRFINGSDRMIMQLKDTTVNGFSNLTVINLGVMPDDFPSRIMYGIRVNIPLLSFESQWNYKGTWAGTRLTDAGRVQGYFKNVTVTFEVKMALTDNREYWNLTDLAFTSKHLTPILTIGKADVNFGKNFLDDETATKIDIQEWVEREMIVKLWKHSFPKIEEFLQMLLQRIRWYAIFFGKFDPEDYELYHGNLMA